MKRYFIILFLAAIVAISAYIYKISLQYKQTKFIENLYKNLNKPNKIEKNILYKTLPEEALLEEFIKTVDPELQYVPKERLITAFKKIKETKSGLKTGNIGWEEIPANMGGRTRAIMWDPTDSINDYKKVWAGGVTGGLWYNNDITNKDSCWHIIDDFWENLVVNCIISDPNDPETFYIGTGEAITAVITYRESSGVGIGIWKTTDAGKTWNLLPSTNEFEYITDIEIRNNGGISEIYAGVVSGKYQGININSAPSDGLYKSTDGGENWAQILPNISGTTTPYAVSNIEIGADNRIYVGTMRNIDQVGGGHLLYSDNGLVWTDVSFVSFIETTQYYNIPGRVIIASAPSDPNRVYALACGGYKASNSFIYGRCYNILKSENKGETWVKINIPNDNEDGINWSYIAWHALTATVHPTNPNTLYAACAEFHRTTDGGITWKRIANTNDFFEGTGTDSAYTHADHHSLIFKPNSTDEMIIGTDGGIFYTETASDVNPAFIEKNKGYNTLQYYTCGIHPGAGYEYYIGGLQDNGTTRSKNGAAIDRFDIVGFGDGTYVLIDEDEPNIQITTVYWNLFYISSDNFETFNEYDEYFRTTGTFVNPMDYDSDLNTIYANAGSSYMENLNQYLKISGIPDNPFGELVTISTTSHVPFSFVKVSPFSPSGTTTLFLGSTVGKLYKIKNAESNPISIDLTPYNFPIANISSIDIGKNGDHILVTFSNYGVSSVWISYNGGIDWAEKEGNLHDIPVRWGIFHPTNHEKVLLATELGIWSTENIDNETVNWIQENNGLGNVRVDMLRIRKSDHEVLAATHGRGLHTGIFEPAPSTGINEFYLSEEVPIKVYPNPVLDYAYFELKKPIKGNLSIFNNLGQLILEKEITTKITELDLSRYNSGYYYLNFETDKYSYCLKILKIK